MEYPNYIFTFLTKETQVYYPRYFLFSYFLKTQIFIQIITKVLTNKLNFGLQINI